MHTLPVNYGFPNTRIVGYNSMVAGWACDRESLGSHFKPRLWRATIVNVSSSHVSSLKNMQRVDEEAKLSQPH